ncbi:MAG: malto-oligosyltrehalose synthase [Deltaproteobacteria bacterium]
MRIPSATYRIQLNHTFGFRDLSRIVPYLAELGISHVYASPIFRARKGSLHGYDVVDPNQLNPELGSEADFLELMKSLAEHGMAWLQDIVPNHMAFDRENAMLMDVLENGQRSRYYDFFDIEWDHAYVSMKGRLLAPFLGRFYGESLEQGEISLHYGAGGFTARYYDFFFPLKMESYVRLLTYRLDTLQKQLGRDHPDFIKLLGILYMLKGLPSRREEEGYDQIDFIKRTLWELYTTNRPIQEFLNENMRLFNGENGDYGLLNELLSDQLFRLSFWKVAGEEINYRRFFSINDLICLKAEKEEVFDHTHALILDLVKAGKFNGLRIDHIDGLYDPAAYLKRLREKAGEVYVVVEKILGPEEGLPPSWPVQGTTGYDFMVRLNGLFCRKENEKALSRVYARFTRLQTPYEDLEEEKKRLILEKHMTGDVDNLSHMLKAISSRDRYGSDITLHGLNKALVEIMAAFPVYRTYVNRGNFRHEDRVTFRKAVATAKQKNPGLVHELDFVERFLLLEGVDHLSDDEKAERVGFIMRFQQFTGPLMAKAFEDTLLYVYNRLVSLNEVGGSPDRFGITADEFHRFGENRRHQWPHTMNATSTHDAKRGEDVRARINVLSEMPEEWDRMLKTWSRINRRKKKRVRGSEIPDRNDEYFFYQTLIGAFPFAESEHADFVERMKGYAIKAVREAKVHTAWLKPDTVYEEAYTAFVEEALKDSEEKGFMEHFMPFQRKVAHYGVFNALSMAVTKMTFPGMPDFYQGTELWDLNLVDPDNRRPVDFQKRERGLLKIREREAPGLAAELLSEKGDGRVKLFLIYKVLGARNLHGELFQLGSYIPLDIVGSHRNHVVAFARNHGEAWAVTVTPRFLTGLVQESELPLGEKVWEDTALVLPAGAPRRWTDAVTDYGIEGEGSLLLAQVLKTFPAALLLARGNG